MNRHDPLDNLGNGAGEASDSPPMPDAEEFDFPLVSQRSSDDLEAFGMNMEEDYRDFKSTVLSWLTNYGKDPEAREGLADTTIKSTHYKLETIFRWLWRDEGGYTTEFTPDHADRFIRLYNQSNSVVESTVLHHAKDIKRYFKFCNHAHGKDYDWELDDDIELSQQNGGDEREYLRRAAFKPLYQAALEHSSVKSYYTVSPEEREEMKRVISQRLQMPMEEVGPDEFEKANSWKYPSMIAASLDCGLRPIEVGRAKVSWVNLEDSELNIPKDESTKNEGHWNCSIKSKTANALDRWLDERAALEKYDGRDELWLTQRSNPYGSSSCNGLLQRIIESGDVPIPENQNVNFYMIRHGVATSWANHVGPHHAKEQLRHKSVTTTMKYLHSDAETRKGAVEQLW
jgi:integrase